MRGGMHTNVAPDVIFLLQLERSQHMQRTRVVLPCLPQFEKACKEVLAEDHQLDAGEERQFDDVQVRCSSMCVLHALCGEMGVTGTGS